MGQRSTHPFELLLSKVVLVTGPSEGDAILDTRLIGVHVLHDGQLKPGPSACDGVIAKALIVRLGKQLHTLDPANGLGV